VANYVEGYLSAIPEGQQQAIKALLDLGRASGEISTTEEYSKELERLLTAAREAGDFKPSFKPPYVDEKTPQPISSTMLNDMFISILADLSGLYHQANMADRTLLVHEALRKADWVRVRDAVNKVTEDLIRHRYLKLNTDWQDVRYFDFWTARVNEPTSQAAAIDPETKTLTLGPKAVHRTEQLRGPTATTAEVYEITSAAEEGSSSGLDEKHALDSNVKRFWAHLLLMDHSVQTEWKGTTYDGALVGYTMTFSNAEFINTVSLLPFSNFPLQLVDLEYYDGEWTTVPGFTAPVSSLDWTSVRFDRVQASAIRLVLHQPSFIRNMYLVPRHAFNLAKLWEQVLDEELLLGQDEEDLTGAQQAEIETNPRFRSYLYALQQVEERLDQTGIIGDVLEDHENVGRSLEAITKVVADTRRSNGLILQKVVNRETDADSESDTDLLEIDKVEYLFGLRHVRAWDVNYLPVGIYRSPKFAMRANPYEVAIDVSESHVDLTAPEGGGATYRQSSVEYELELSADRRIPILPQGTTLVPDELLVVDRTTGIGALRFTPQGAVTGRASGRLLVQGTDFTVSGKIVTIASSIFTPTARYTFSYVPTAGHGLLNIDTTYDSVALVAPEVHDHTDTHGMIELNYYPYVAYEVINSDTDWVRMGEDALWSYRVAAGDVTIDGQAYGPTSGVFTYRPLSVFVNGILAVNITDYRRRVHPGFRDDPDNSPTLQYLHAGKKLYFSRPMKDATIEVNYRWMVQYIRLNVTLRGHGAVVNSYTPELTDYLIKMRTGR
jgi:hypothetical protein